MKKSFAISVLFMVALSLVALGYKGYVRFLSIDDKPEKQTNVVRKNMENSSSKESKKILKHYAKTMHDISAPSKNKKYFLHYSINTERSEGAKNENIRSDVIMYMSHRCVFYESDLISYYKDTSEVFTVVHPQKLIFNYKNSGDDINKAKKVSILPLQDSLFSNAEITSSGESVFNGKSVRTITVVPDRAMQNRTGMNKLVYYYNDKQEFMEGQDIYYLPGNGIVKSTYTFHELNLKYKGKMKNKAADYIYEKGRLTDRWKGYSLEE